jgi:opacity protein-like surface antigen
MMKKLLLMSVFCLGIISVSAQRFGIKAGVNFANAIAKEEGIGLSTSSLTGPQFGVVGEFTLSNDWFFNSGLLYSQKGLKMDYMGVEVKFPVRYLEVPFNFAYKHDMESVKLFAQAGPYLGIGLSAKATTGDEEIEIEFGSDDDQIKGLDFGLNIGAGIEIEKAQIGISYGLGLVNLENEDEAKMKNSVISISFAYFFGN